MINALEEIRYLRERSNFNIDDHLIFSAFCLVFRHKSLMQTGDGSLSGNQVNQNNK